MATIIIDANILIVFVIGTVDPKLLGSVKRVKEYRPSDHDLLTRYLDLFTKVVLLPNTVSEASNLLDHLKGDRRQACMALLAELVIANGETYVPSDIAVSEPEYLSLGVTDAAILNALRSDSYLLTADRALFLAATARSCEAQLFADLR